ncbi:hypothetical protein CANCADRAFT_3647 [Tortispora caseinolytica NRRL Y-17796]|uniref:Translation initiation factor eIF2B subunit alpha n=1 Tax=Tortispora caseinolytica NRRL Y-17796 TaxID=767744 RepID=A0A1E4TB53_9ASCO|nr:hypothetical protein CANCADRAFT_3647 [Tortispora caseinolytica NRRL Y-17796]
MLVSETASEFDITTTYHKFLHDDPEITMPVAAIESLVTLLSLTRPQTSSELVTVLTKASATLKENVRNSVSLSAGCDLFLRFVLRSTQDTANWEACWKHLVDNGKLFLERARKARQEIAKLGSRFIRDGDTILIHSMSRTVTSLLFHALERNVRFQVVVTEARPDGKGVAIANILREKGIHVALISDTSVVWAMDKIDKVFVGAEGVAESGGVINYIGTAQIALMAKGAGKPFYVVAESHKFVRLFPLSSSDLPGENSSLQFTSDISSSIQAPDIDFTPENLITSIITDIGILTPAGVSEELIKMWYD